MDFKVIVTINEKNADRYNALFAKAYRALEAKGWLKDEAKNSEGRFLSLNHYLAHAKELFNLDDKTSGYLLIPLDEPAFAINADSRAIAPAKVVVLQNDNFAETIQFTVDRYFDHMDLNEARIFVQWTLPDGTEGATWADELKDLTIPGKIRFGWTLTSDVTAQPGIVKFSVRFWNKALDEVDGQEKVVYSFNTLTSSLTISPSLQPIVNDENSAIAPKGSGLFEKAIIDSQILVEGTPLPLSPHFSSPGLNLRTEETLVDNTLTLRAQAIVGDTGSIDYEWYYTPAVDTPLMINGEEYIFSAKNSYPFKDIVKDGKVILPGFEHFGGTVNNLDYQLFDYTSTGKLNFGDRYFVKNGSRYDPYGETTVPDSGDLYERYTSYTVPSGDAKVTGTYIVKATNTITPNVSLPQPSNPCVLIGPDVVTLTKDLEESRIILDSEKGVDLTIGSKPQRNQATQVKYSWAVNTQSNAINFAEDLKPGNGTIYNTKTPGWYQSKVEATLNRETKEMATKVCKVTFYPKIPILDYDEATKAMIGEGSVIPTFTGNAVLNVVIVSSRPEEYEGKTEFAEELFSEGYTYRWTKQQPDGVETPVTAADVTSGLIEGPIDGPSLAVKEQATFGTYAFKCYVTNYLNGKDIESKASDALCFYVSI